MTDPDGLLAREEQRRAAGHRLLDDLGVLDAWASIGQPTVEGAMALQLVVARDIDVEVLAPTVDLRQAVAVWLDLRLQPAVTRGSVIERPEPPFAGIYFLLVALDSDAREWSIETWVFPEDRTMPRGADLVEPLSRPLDEELRAAILAIKEGLSGRLDLNRVPSVRVYEAVVDHGVRELSEFLEWVSSADASSSPWMPA